MVNSNFPNSQFQIALVIARFSIAKNRTGNPGDIRVAGSVSLRCYKRALARFRGQSFYDLSSYWIAA
ncbi:MAG: hypothetical protein QOC96_3373 [Acidobacteriota bacterium]|jgi:hypothetical protein|nr:hypothetical protein [Acidobacteriota bacterium]